MSTATTLAPTDTMMILQGGVNKKVSVTTFLKSLDSADSIKLNPGQYAINISLSSKNDENAIFVNGNQDKVGFGTNAPQSKVHVNGNIQCGSATTDGIIVQSTESLTAVDSLTVYSISTIREGSVINCNSGISGKFTLPAGYNGQIKFVAIGVLSAGNNTIISLGGLGFNTLTCTAVGNSVTLEYISSISKWCVISLYGATASTV